MDLDRIKTVNAKTVEVETVTSETPKEPGTSSSCPRVPYDVPKMTIVITVKAMTAPPIPNRQANMHLIVTNRITVSVTSHKTLPVAFNPLPHETQIFITINEKSNTSATGSIRRLTPPRSSPYDPFRNDTDASTC